MSDFIEPITKELTFTLRKQLAHGEEICPTCQGLGYLISNNPYGLKNDDNQIIWYKNQSLMPCVSCFNGVVKRCPYCGKLLARTKLKCNCREQRAIDRMEEERKEQERMDNAKEVPAEQFDMYYSEWYSPDDGYFDCFEDFFLAWENSVYCGDCTDDDRPEFVYGTMAVEMRIDADYIVEAACEDLYEDAECDIGTEEMIELQAYLNDWCAKCGVAKTFYYDKNFKVRIPWEEYDND